MAYSNFEIEKILKSMTFLVDTREKDTDALRRRLDQLGKPYKRAKLDFGDYTAEYTDLDGNIKNMSDIAVIERKQSLDELAGNFTRERERFEREFERAKAQGSKIYLLVEGATWEKLFKGSYRSKLNPESFAASILAWSIRYNMHFIFCKEDTSADLIKRILYRELKEKLSNDERDGLNHDKND